MIKYLKIIYKIYNIIAISLFTGAILIYTISLFMDHNNYKGEQHHLSGHIASVDKDSGIFHLTDEQGKQIANNVLAGVSWQSHTNDACAAEIQQLINYAKKDKIAFNGTYTEGLHIHIKKEPTELKTHTGSLNARIQAIIDHHHPSSNPWW